MKRIMRNSKNSLFGNKNPEEQPVHAEAKPIEGVTSETQETELAPIVEESGLTERDVYDFVKAYAHDFSQAAATAKDNSPEWNEFLAKYFAPGFLFVNETMWKRH